MFLLTYFSYLCTFFIGYSFGRQLRLRAMLETSRRGVASKLRGISAEKSRAILRPDAHQIADMKKPQWMKDTEEEMRKAFKLQ